jgi:DNA repair protein RAD50
LKAAREDFEKKKEDLRKCEAAVLASIITPDGELSSIDDHQSELEKLEYERDEVKKELDGVDYSSKYFKSCLGYVQQHNACKLCTRKFDDDKQQSTALQKLNTLINKAAKEQLQKDLEVVEGDLRKENMARSQYDTCKTLKAEAPSLQSAINKFEATQSSLLARLEKHDSLVNEAESAKRDVEALTETVRAISRCSSDIAKHETDVTRLSSTQTLFVSSRSTDEIHQLMAACEEQIRSLEAKINKISSDKDQARTARYDLEKEVDAISRDLKSVHHELEKKQALLSQIEELRENSAQLRGTIRRADAELEPLRPRLTRHRRSMKKCSNVVVPKRRKPKMIRMRSLIP